MFTFPLVVYLQQTFFYLFTEGENVEPFHHLQILLKRKQRTWDGGTFMALLPSESKHFFFYSHRTTMKTPEDESSRVAFLKVTLRLWTNCCFICDSRKFAALAIKPLGTASLCSSHQTTVFCISRPLFPVNIIKSLRLHFRCHVQRPLEVRWLIPLFLIFLIQLVMRWELFFSAVDSRL